MENALMGQRHLSSLILVVEDNSAQLETLIDILEQEGLHPLGYSTGKEAIKACQEQKFPVAILDLRLPDMNGLDVLSQIKKILPEVNVIINTAYATLESAMEAVNREAFAYIQKMGNVEELLMHVHRAFIAHYVGYSERLEKEVSERTAEISKANAALKKEIEVRTQAETQLKAALKEKEVLMKEILHRTKNNMAAVSSLLTIQSARVNDAQVLHSLEEINHRIQAMLLVQKKLYQSHDFRNIDLKDYLEDLSTALFRNLYINSGRITLELEVDHAMVIPDTAIPCGLLLNELLTNALKYAFPEDRNGIIRIALHRKDSQLLLQVSDNGIGLPADIDIQHVDSLGLQLVGSFIQQLQGNLEIQRENGTTFIIRFPNNH